MCLNYLVVILIVGRFAKEVAVKLMSEKFLLLLLDGMHLSIFKFAGQLSR